jgi:hypothetical protein
MTNYQASDVKQCQLIVNGTQITGAVDGDWITFDVPEIETVVVDANSNSYVIKKGNKNITLTVNLSSASPSTEYLSNLWNLRRSGINTKIPVRYNDFSRGSQIDCENCSINMNSGTLSSNNDVTDSWTIVLMDASFAKKGLQEI